MRKGHCNGDRGLRLCQKKTNTFFLKKNIAFYIHCHFANQSVGKFLDVVSFLTSFNVTYGYCRLLICFGLKKVGKTILLFTVVHAAYRERWFLTTDF